jgi:hypothetical protein
VVAVGRTDRERDAAVAALAHLGQGGIGLISESEAERGLRRVMAELSDLVLDTPAARGLVEALVAKLAAAAVISADADLEPAAKPAEAAATSAAV